MLNEEQLKAATHPMGEAAILLAGAGSGKTTTLTQRISWLIKQGVAPRKILAITFTNKAANEICERVLKATGLPEEQAPRLSTIHSLCLSMIRRNPEGFGYGPKVSPLDDYDQTELVKKIIAREELGEDVNPWQALERIAFHRARGIGFSADYSDEVHKRAQKEHAGYHAMSLPERKVWALFEQEKQATSSLDFDDMIWAVIRRMGQDSEWLRKLQAQFEHVIVDEAQDTNIPQFMLITNLLGPDNRNLMLTGDLGQSIYGFNGAAPYLLKQFAEGWRGKAPVLYRLVRNHRSVPQIVQFANNIQQQFTESLPLQMESFRGQQGERGRVGMLRGEAPAEMARMIAHSIGEADGPLKNFAILVRSSLQVREIEGELVRMRIPYVVRGGRGLLQTEEVRDVLAYIRFATNTRDFSALSRALSAPKRGLGDAALEAVRKKANDTFNGDLLLACAASNTKFEGFANVIREIQRFTAHPVQALNAAISLSEYVSYLKRKYSKDKEKIEAKVENLSRLREMIDGLAVEQNLSTEDVVFQLTMDRGRDNDERGVVTISTIHSSKGLEWPTVYVYGCTEGQLPHWRSVGSDSEIDEERRLFYVAVTRARDVCCLCVSEKAQRGPHLTLCEPSRFLTELGIR